MDSSQKDNPSCRLVFNDTADIAKAIGALSEGASLKSRAVAETYSYSSTDQEFQSLAMAQRSKLYATLTAEQKEEIKSDPEGLSFCMVDSVIADYYFAQLLNAKREIQVGNTVYKYYSNGVAYADVMCAMQLDGIDDLVASIVVTPENQMSYMKITDDVGFRPLNYDLNDDTQSPGDPNLGSLTDFDETFDGHPGSISPIIRVKDTKMLLPNGLSLDPSQIRDVDYNSKGDGTWIHRTTTNLFGKYVIAKNYFDDTHRMTLRFYDQNYIIYAKIGTTVNMQKKKFGLWWNCKSQEMLHGWGPIIVEYSLPNPIPAEAFKHPDMNNPTILNRDRKPFPFNPDRYVMHIPFTDYDFTTPNLNDAFAKAVKKAFDSASNWAKEIVIKPENLSLSCAKDKKFYYIHGPFYRTATERKEMSDNFHFNWFAGSFEFTFSIGDTFKLKSIKFVNNDSAELYRGVVYGAVKYNNTWLGARITKDSD